MRWRVIITDSESLTGVAPVCEHQDDPTGPHALDGMQLVDSVCDCCPHPHIETYNERYAAFLVEYFNANEIGICL